MAASRSLSVSHIVVQSPVIAAPVPSRRFPTPFNAKPTTSCGACSAAAAEPALGVAEAKGRAGVEDDKQLAFFEALRKRQVESFNQQEEVARQLRIQAERDEVARIGWKRAAKKLLGRLRGSQWDPLPGADVDFADFWALLQMGRVKFVNYGDNGRFVEVILPHPAKDLGLEVQRGDGARKKGNQAARQAAPKAAEEAAAGEAGEVAGEEAEAVGHMGRVVEAQGAPHASKVAFERLKSLLYSTPYFATPSLSGRVVEAQGAPHASRRAFRALFPPPLTLCPSLLTSLGSLLTSLGSLLTSLGSLLTSLGSLLTSLGSLLTSLGSLLTSLGSLLSSLGSLLTSLGSLLTSLGSLLTSLGSLLTSLGSLRTSLGSLLTSLGSLLTSLGSLLTSLGSLRTSLGSLLTSLGSLLSIPPSDVHSEVWSLLRTQLAHITLTNRPSAFPPAPFTTPSALSTLSTISATTAPAPTALPSPPSSSSLFPSLLPASSAGLLGSTVGTIQLAATWGLRLALACGLYVGLERVLFPLYQPTKLEERPRSSHRKLTAVLNPDLGTMGQSSHRKLTAVLNPDLGTMGQSRARYISAEEKTGITFDDFAGQDYVKRELQEVVRILRAAKEFEDLGVYCPKGVLLFGPPGTGKTLLAKAIAGEAGVPFFSVSGAEFVEMFAGVAASRVKDLFFRARQFAPAIIFIDEIDAIGSKRGTASDQGGGNIEREQGLIQILTELDGFQENQAKVLVIGATNRLDMLDPALLRKGRFDTVLVIGATNRLDMLDPALLRKGRLMQCTRPPLRKGRFDKVLVIGATNRLGMLDPALLRCMHASPLCHPPPSHLPFSTHSPPLQVLVIGATNRLDMLDPALLRKGRFDKVVRVGLPTEEGRFSVLKVRMGVFGSLVLTCMLEWKDCLPLACTSRCLQLQGGGSTRWCAWDYPQKKDDSQCSRRVLAHLLRKGRFDKVVRAGLVCPQRRGDSQCSKWCAWGCHGGGTVLPRLSPLLPLSTPSHRLPSPCSPYYRFPYIPTVAFPVKVHARNKAFKSEEEKLKLLREIAAATPDYSGAELMNILNEAAILAIRKDKDEIEREELLQAIDRQAGEFKTGEENVLDSREQAGEFKTGEEDVLDSREVRMRAAYREASIAVLECALPDRSGPIKRTSLDNVDPLPNLEHERLRHRCFAVKQDMKPLLHFHPYSDVSRQCRPPPQIGAREGALPLAPNTALLPPLVMLPLSPCPHPPPRQTSLDNVDPLPNLEHERVRHRCFAVKQDMLDAIQPPSQTAAIMERMVFGAANVSWQAGWPIGRRFETSQNTSVFTWPIGRRFNWQTKSSSGAGVMPHLHAVISVSPSPSVTAAIMERMVFGATNVSWQDCVILRSGTCLTCSPHSLPLSPHLPCSCYHGENGFWSGQPAIMERMVFGAVNVSWQAGVAYRVAVQLADHVILRSGTCLTCSPHFLPLSPHLPYSCLLSRLKSQPEKRQLPDLLAPLPAPFSPPALQLLSWSAWFLERPTCYHGAHGVRCGEPAIMERMVFGAANVSWQAGVAYREAVQLADYVILRSGMSALGKVVYETQKDLMPHLIPKVIALREEYMRYSKAKCEAVLKEYRSAVDTIAGKNNPHTPSLKKPLPSTPHITPPPSKNPYLPLHTSLPLPQKTLTFHSTHPSPSLKKPLPSTPHIPPPPTFPPSCSPPHPSTTTPVPPPTPSPDLHCCPNILPFIVDSETDSSHAEGEVTGDAINSTHTYPPVLLPSCPHLSPSPHPLAPQPHTTPLNTLRASVGGGRERLLEEGEVTGDAILRIYDAAPKFPQPLVRPIDEYAVLVHQGRWGIHGASLPGRVTFHPGNSGYATFGAPRPQQVQAVSDETWKVVEGMWRERIAELRQMDEEDEEEREQQLLLLDLVL
ncbi:unnamed protein product [Closterium sp. NIES-65]|nr:unnamed protein product [Closterium sp. NIES-65]